MFIQRNAQGQIVGAFANRQPRLAEEFMHDDSSELAAFLSPPEQVLRAANARRDELLAMAAIRVAPLQDAVDIGRATPTEEAELLAWKNYRVDLIRIDQQPDFPEQIDWPLSPSETE